jgi:hypothetical protein
MYTIPEAIKKLQNQKSNTILQTEDTNLFNLWNRKEIRSFTTYMRHKKAAELNISDIAFIGAFISGDVVGVLPNGKMVIVIHDDTSVVLISEVKCEEFVERLLSLDENLERDTYERVIPIEE